MFQQCDLTCYNIRREFERNSSEDFKKGLQPPTTLRERGPLPKNFWYKKRGGHGSGGRFFLNIKENGVEKGSLGDIQVQWEVQHCY